VLPPLESPQHLHRRLRARGFPKIAPRSTTVVSAASTTAPRSRPAHRRRLWRARRVRSPRLARPARGPRPHRGNTRTRARPSRAAGVGAGIRSQDDHLSRIRVTGPSFTSSTSIIAQNPRLDPGSALRSPLPEQGDKPLVQRHRPPWCGVHELVAGPSSCRRRGVNCDTTARLHARRQGEVHLACRHR